MSSKNLIQVFEFQKLNIGDNGFKKKHFEALVKFNDLQDNKYFNVGFNKVTFKSYVGVIQIGGLTIEILPKADKSDFNIQQEKDTWQGVLLHMLKVCKKIQVETVSETKLKKRYHSILEVYFAMYLEEIEHLAKRGLIKKYRRNQNNQLALKGKLVFSKNIQKNTVHKERFYCEYQVYDKNHLIHQILLKGLHVLESLNTSNLADKTNRLLFQFEATKYVNITAKHFENISLDRKSQPYERALNIAKMLILNYSPNISFGQENMLTLLFDMNKLWEEYIFRILNKHKPNGYSVSFQNSDKFWEHKSIRPDIVISDSEKKVFIIDTKWKIVEYNNPSDDDLKQMFTYNLHWRAEKSMLLYPKTSQVEIDYGNFHYQQTIKNDDETVSLLKNMCRLGYVSIIKNESLRNSELIAQEIFFKLKN
tara:strand:- start:20384 stop:21646 length:1263 start_codon:yes stop_codon:yes gene_type:complete